MSHEASGQVDPFERAVSLHEAGCFAEAAEQYTAVLGAEGEDAVLLELLGAALASMGDNASAARHLDRSLEIDPDVSTARLQRGIVLERLGRFAEAIEDYRHGLQVDPASIPLYERLGVVLCARGDYVGARAVFAKAIEDGVDDGSLSRRRIEIAMRAGKLEEAAADAAELMGREPADFPSLVLLAQLCSTLGRSEKAVVFARRASEISPDSVEAIVAMAMALVSMQVPESGQEAISLLNGPSALLLKPEDRERLLVSAEIASGRLSEAADRLERWIESHPGDAHSLGLLASVQRARGGSEAALATIRRAIRVDPNSPGVLVELGLILLDRGDAEGAIKVFRDAIDSGRRTRVVSLGLIESLKRRGLIMPALEEATEALSRDPEDFDLRAVRAMILHDLCRHSEAEQEGWKSVRVDAPSPSAISNHLFGLQYGDGQDESEITRAHVELARRIPGTAGSPLTSRDAGRTLRVGLVSSDFKRHSVAWFLLPLLRASDPSCLTMFAYSNTAGADSVTESIRASVHGWREIRGGHDVDVEQLIRGDSIDVLIDLGGHTGDNRLGLFRRRPAPVQISWLGYPNTTGVPEIAWRLVDEVTDPPGFDQYASEALLRMESPFLCFDNAAERVPLHQLADRAPVIGSFNNLAKLSDRCIRLWSRLMMALPDATLLLKSRSLEDPLVREAVTSRLSAFGVQPSRVLLRGFSREQATHHLAFADLDVAIDTFPYHGTTTTCEALWNGVPVVSRIGESHRSRVGATILSSVGLPELAARTDDEFVEVVGSLLSRRDQLGMMRATLRDRMSQSRLCDAEGFARRFEAAVRHAWTCWCRGDSPQGAFLSTKGP